MSGSVRAALAFTAVVLRSISRDRTALLFVLILPVAVIVIIGTTFGSQERLTVGLVIEGQGQLAEQIESALDEADGIELERFDDVESLRRAVRRNAVSTGVLLPADLDRSVRGGGPASVRLVANPASPSAITARTAIEGALAPVGASLGAARFATETAGGTFDENLALAGSQGGADGEAVIVEDIGSARAAGVSRFALTAPQNLVLFVFINSMASAGFLVNIRHAGVLRRSLSTRSGMGTVLTGLGVGWFIWVLLQSLLIVGVGAVLFGVDWGDPLAAALLVVAFAAVGCGAGLLVGALGRNEDRVTSITPIVGLVLGALGGCMIPLDVFPEPMRVVAHVVPQFWAIEGWQQLIFDGDGLGGIARSLAVLSGFAVMLLGAATVALRRDLTR